MPFRFFKATDMIGFTFAPHYSVNFICSWLAENGSWLALVIGSVIALVLVFNKKT